MAPIERYSNDRPKLGLVEIINNLDNEQKATQNDVRELMHTFRWIGMEVKRPHFDLKEVEMKTKIDKILDPKRNLKEFDMFILVIICHGREGDELLSADGKVCLSVSKIVEKFDALIDMKGRPKILILESCRGGNDNLGMQVTFNASKSSQGSSNVIHLPDRADMFIAFGTVPDYVAYTESKGSPFVLTLGPKIRELAETNHLDEIMTAVQGELSGRNIDGCKQMAEKRSTLRSLLYLTKKEKTYFKEGFDVNGIKYRKFGDRNGWGQMCLESQDFCCCNFQDGNQSWTGRHNHEWPSGDVQEVDLHPGAKYGDWTGDGVRFHIREKWRYEGQIKECKKPGSEEIHDFYHGNGIYYYEDGSFYIGAFEYHQKCGYGTYFTKDQQIIDIGIWKDDKIHKSFKK